jgi:hypothetical protein
VFSKFKSVEALLDVTVIDVVFGVGIDVDVVGA